MSEHDSGPDADVDALRQQIHELRRQVAARRAARAPEPVEDYELTGGDGNPVRLSALFGRRRDLVVVHNMGTRCPMCTLWADGFNGLLPHLEDRFAFVVASPDGPAEQAEFAQGRGWRFRMVSTRGTTFAADLGFEGEHEGAPFPLPGVSVFQRTEDGGVVRVGRDFFGPDDDYCAMWPLMSLFPEGQDDWWPKLSYPAD